MKYIYVYLDPRKPGNYIYDNYKFEIEPFYVGIGTRSDRMFTHLKEAKNSTKNSHKLNKIRAIINDGYEPVIIKLLEGLSKNEYKQKEIDIIKKIGRRCDGGPLCNLTPGGDGGLGGATTTGRKLTDEHKLKISLGGKGIKKPLDFGDKVSKRLSGKKLGTYEEQFGNEEAERRKNILRKNGTSNFFYGKVHTDETKKKISQANKGRKDSEETKIKKSAASFRRSEQSSIQNSKTVICNNGCEIIEFRSTILCAEYFGLHPVTIQRKIKNNEKIGNWQLTYQFG